MTDSDPRVQSADPSDDLAPTQERAGAPIRRRGHDLGFWLVVMNTRFSANAGLVMRVASNFGASGVALVGSDRFKRAPSLGTSSSVPVLHFPTPEAAVDWFHKAGIPLVCAELTDRSVPIHEAEWPSRVGLVIGEERDGVPRALLDAAEVVVEIPMYGLAGSMNLALAAGILAYEHVRRLGFPELERLSAGGRRSGWLTHPHRKGAGGIRAESDGLPEAGAESDEGEARQKRG